MKTKKATKPLKDKQIENVNEQLLRFKKEREMSGPIEELLAEAEFVSSDFNGWMPAFSTVLGAVSLYVAVAYTDLGENLGSLRPMVIFAVIAIALITVLATRHNDGSPAAMRAASAIYQHRLAIQGTDRESPKVDASELEANRTPMVGKIVLLGATLGTVFLAGSRMRRR